MTTLWRWISTSELKDHHTAAAAVFMIRICALPPPSQPKGRPTSRPEKGAQPWGYAICPGTRTTTWLSETPAELLNFTATGTCESGWSPTPKPGVGTVTRVSGTIGSLGGWTAMAWPSWVSSKKDCHGKSKFLIWMLPAASWVARESASVGVGIGSSSPIGVQGFVHGDAPRSDEREARSHLEW